MREEGLAIQQRVGVKSKMDMVVNCGGGGDNDDDDSLQNLQGLVLRDYTLNFQVTK